MRLSVRSYGICLEINHFLLQKIRLKEKFNAHINLRNNVDFVKNFVDLFDLLIEYRDLKSESSEELKTFYLNEILVSNRKSFLLKLNG